jgi:hypothetical protein
MVALLASPLTRPMDRLSDSEWMRRKGMRVIAADHKCRSLAPREF